jgi:hypothetical protein
MWTSERTKHPRYRYFAENTCITDTVTVSYVHALNEARNEPEITVKQADIEAAKFLKPGQFVRLAVDERFELMVVDTPTYFEPGHVSVHSLLLNKTFTVGASQLKS